MNLATTIRIFAQSAGTQVTDQGEGDAWVKRYLDKKQTKLNKLRKSVTPYPEDKKGIQAVKKEVGHWSPAPEDVADLNKKSYKSGMKKAKTLPRFPFVGPPGTQPLQNITGADELGDIHCVIVKKGSQHCVMSEDRSKNLGCGPSRAWAHKRLAEVEYFKRKG